MTPFIYKYVKRLLREVKISESKRKFDYPKFYFIVALIQAEAPQFKKEQVEERKINLMWRTQGRAFNEALGKYVQEEGKIETWKTDTKIQYYRVQEKILRLLRTIAEEDYKRIVLPYLRLAEEERLNEVKEYDDDLVEPDEILGRTIYGASS